MGFALHGWNLRAVVCAFVIFFGTFFNIFEDFVLQFLCH